MTTPPGATTAGETRYDELLRLLLEVCETFFSHTTSATRQELDAVLRAHGVTGGPGWLTDMLALTRLHLRQRPSRPLR